MNELLKINANEFNLTQEKVNELIIPFIPLADEYLSYIPKIENIKYEAKKEITLDIVSKAKRIKLDIAKIRNTTGKTKDNEKAGVLQIGNAIQKCHNLIVKTIEEQEEELEKIVKYFENQEKERITKLQTEREEILKPFIKETIDLINLGEMEQDKFDGYLLLKKTKFKEKKELEVKLEKERQEIEDKRKADELLVIKENARLEAEAKVMIDKIKAEMKAKADLERVQKEKQEAINNIKREQEEKELAEKRRKEDEENARLEAEKNEKEEKELAEKRQEFIKYRDSLNFDHYEDKDGFRIFYKKVGEFLI